MTEALLKEVYDALDLEMLDQHVGSLNVNRKAGQYTQSKLDEARLFGMVIQGFMCLNEDATLDFLSALHVDGQFPQQELLEALARETNKPENILIIKHNGSGRHTFCSSHLHKIKRGELVNK